MMKLHLLGINGPFPESGGATSGYLLEADNCLFQFDLGSGVLAQLTALTAPESLSGLFLSHWHFDHASDLPVLMYRLEALKKVLPVWAPADEHSDLFRLVSACPCFSLTTVRPGDQLVFDNTVVRVTSARHPVPAVGYRVECGGRAFGYTGDTNTLTSLSEDFCGCGLLLADGLFPEENWAEEKPHLSAALAARLAEEAGCGKLVVTHLNPVYPPELLLAQARPVHADTVIARAGDVWEL